MVIQKLRDAYFKKIHLHFCPTIRLESGLAMSSRNERLTQQGLKKAASIYKSLSHVKNLYQQVVPKDALYFARHLLEENGFKVEYLDKKRWIENLCSVFHLQKLRHLTPAYPSLF